jgi:nucleoside-specific outer membrane channel protein Tsx
MFWPALCSLFAAPAAAVEWSDTSLNWRYGASFAEPFNNQPIHKHILGLTHVNGYQYGRNFISVELLISDSKDPESFGSKAGAQEVYVIYRHLLDIGKVRGEEIRFGPVRGLGLTAGFDVNRKEDAGYNSRKRMFVLGPTFMLDTPGFCEVSLLALNESNQPSASPGAFNPGYPSNRYTYKTHPMLGLVWGIPLGEKFAFEGYANFIAAKGRSETGANTAAETNIDLRLMADLSHSVGLAKNSFKLGVEYQYWKNKFGNDHSGPAGNGAFARTPMIRGEWRF